MFCVLFMCKCVLPPGVNPIAVDKYINKLRHCSTCIVSADGDNTKLHIVQAIHTICVSHTSNRAPSMHHSVDHPVQSAPYSHHRTRCTANSRHASRQGQHVHLFSKKDRPWNTPGLIQGQNGRNVKLTTHLHGNGWSYTATPPYMFS
jgi:hypothetical protein